MIIACPNCSTGYLLPGHLVGPGGARVRCPRCQRLFAVGVDGQPMEPAPPAPAAPPPACPPATVEESPAVEPPAGARTFTEEPPAPVERPPAEAQPAAEARTFTEEQTFTEAQPSAEGALDVARMVLGQLALHEGEALERAHAERRLFSEFGPALMQAYEAYRGLAGAEADTAAFREALRERWGVELVSLAAPRD